MTHEALERLFPGVRFAHAISLGGNCETAHGLRVAGRHTVNSVFDWLVTPLDAIALILADDGTRLGTDFVSANEGTSVRCGAYGVLYHHEFPRDAENRVVYTADAIAACKAKLAHKMETFLGLRDQGPVLFIRHELETGLPWDRLGEGKEAPVHADVAALAAAIGRRFPDLDFRVLVTAFEPSGFAAPETPIDPRVAVTAVPRQEDCSWAVADTTWRELLARIDFVGDKAAQSVRIDEKLHWFGDDVAGKTDMLDEAVSASPLAILESALHEGSDARAIAAIPAFVETGGAPEVVWQGGLDLLKAGRSAGALRAFAIAFTRGFRRWPFVCDYLGLLTGETQYSDVLRVIGFLRSEVFEPADPGAARHIAMLSGHAKLSLDQTRDITIERAREREASAAWLDVPALAETISAAIRDRRPFSFIRAGDGEARFLLATTHRDDSPITAQEAHAMGDVCWENWFGDPLPPVGNTACAALLAAYERAVLEADVLGVCSADRLRADTGHYGYLAWQENWLRGILPARGGHRWADAHANRHLNATAPFLSTLLEGQDVIGVISPHPRLADALGRRLRIGRVIGHVIPAEGRLPTASETRALGQHFPTMYQELLASLSVPHPGCVFLVAAGLLGKVYCARIKELGGIALDIGAVVDAWMGYDTRDGQLADVAALAQPPSWGAPQAAAPPNDTTYGCVSFMKTGSMALTHAVREAGFPDAIHLHFIGPRGLEFRRAHPDSTLDLMTRVADRIGDPDHRFRLATSVRDPIARIVSQGFHEAATAKRELFSDHAALLTWWETQAISRFDFWRVWFDDSFKATFGFDFREHVFDHERKSMRFSSGNLRLLVLRQEDEPSRREAELGWLLDRQDVKLRSINDAEHHGYSLAYREFLEGFVAPTSWLDELYETDVIRHFYTAAERDAFRARWRGPQPASTTLPNAPPRKFACLSLGKTSSTALAAALSNAGFSNVAHIHHLGPRSRGQKGPAGVEARAFAAHLDDPTNRFAIVTCMRDPIARWISYAFQKEIEMLGRAGRGVVDSADDFIEWVDANVPSDYLSDWFEDALEATFGFAFADHPFDFSRRSLRFSSDRLRLVIVRQEDPVGYRERELGWLAERDRIEIPVENTSVKRFADRYTAFVDAFVAPHEWLDRFYETKAIRHFYTRAERDAFRARWSKRRSMSSSGIRLDPSPAEQPARAAAPAAAAHTASPASPDKTEDELATLKRRIEEGYVVDFNDYAYRPRERDWSASRGGIALRSRFDAAQDEFAARLETLCGFNERFRAIPVLADATQPYWENWWLPGLDAVALYGLVAALKPRVYLEVGSGHSTRFVRRAIEDNQLATRIVSIDPNPTAQVDAICDEVVRTPCEDMPLSRFATLEAGDLLFFDGSHRSFQNSDATVFFTEILPSVAPGVVYGLHDVFLPYDYPESWLTRFYNEQYLLMAYLLGGAAGDEVLFPAHHVSRHPAFAPLRNRLFLGTKHLDWLVSSFWMRRAAGS